MNSVGKNIKKLRVVRKMSQSAFAKHFNLSRASIGAYEEGRAEPKLDTLSKIATRFNLSLDALVGRDLTTNEALGIKLELLGKPSANKMQKDNAYLLDVPFYDTSSPLLLKGEELSEPARYIRLPKVDNKKKIAWMLSGFGMIRKESVLQQGDVLIFEECLKVNLNAKTAVLIPRESGTPIFARIANDKCTEIVFDNRNFQNEPLDPSDLNVFWRLQAVYSESLVF